MSTEKPTVRRGDVIELLPPKRASKTGRWYFHLRSRNGQVKDQSQGYTRRASARRGAMRLFPGVPVRVRESE